MLILPLVSRPIRSHSFTCDHMGRRLVAMATPQTLLSIRDVMAAQNMMRLGGGGGLRSQGVEALLRGEIKVDLINHRVLRHPHTASPLVAIISVAEQGQMIDVCLHHAGVLHSLHRSAETSLMNLQQKIFLYSFSTDKSCQRL